MPDLSYPFVYECSSCDNETTVEQSDARDLHPNPDSLDAVDFVLEQRGWMQLPIGRIYCPKCDPPQMKE
jgi:hypothetical protein